METTSKQPNMNLMEEDNKITIVPYKKKYLQRKIVLSFR